MYYSRYSVVRASLSLLVGLVTGALAFTVIIPENSDVLKDFPKNKTVAFVGLTFVGLDYFVYRQIHSSLPKKKGKNDSESMSRLHKVLKEIEEEDPGS